MTTTTPPPPTGVHNDGRDDDMDDAPSSPISMVDSAYDSPGRPLSTVTMDSDMVETIEKHGRTYAQMDETVALFPNDTKEQEHLDFLHNLIYHAILQGCPFRCPATLEDATVLDVGAGTGRWAEWVGALQDSCRVIGVDLSKDILPDLMPLNVVFQVCDVERNWTWTQNFNLITVRQMEGSIQDWPRLIHQCHEQLEDGGWLEIHQLGYRHDSQNDADDHKIFELNDRFCEAMFRLGRSVGVAGYVERLLQNMGFEDVTRETIRVPLGTWTKDPHNKIIGALRQFEFEDGLDGLVLEPFSRGLHWSRVEIETFLMEVRQSLRQGQPQLLSEFNVIYGRKRQAAPISTQGSKED